MSKNNKNAAPNKPLTRPKAGAFNTTLHGFFSVVAMMVDRLGWGGALIVLVFFFIQYNGTTEQKQKIIDKFVLGKELDLVYPYIGLGILGIVVFVGQSHYWRKKISILNAEIDRLSKWKSDHQQKQIGVNLHHTENNAKPQ